MFFDSLSSAHGNSKKKLNGTGTASDPNGQTAPPHATEGEPPPAASLPPSPPEKAPDSAAEPSEAPAAGNAKKPRQATSGDGKMRPIDKRKRKPRPPKPPEVSYDGTQTDSFAKTKQGFF